MLARCNNFSMLMIRVKFFSVLFSLIFSFVALAVYPADDGSNPAGDALNKIKKLNEGQGQQDDDLKKNFLVKLFESIYGEFDSNLSNAAVMGIVGIAIVGVFMLRSFPIIGLIMILAPTSVYFFVQKMLEMLK